MRIVKKTEDRSNSVATVKTAAGEALYHWRIMVSHGLGGRFKPIEGWDENTGEPVTTTNAIHGIVFWDKTEGQAQEILDQVRNKYPGYEYKMVRQDREPDAKPDAEVVPNTIPDESTQYGDNEMMLMSSAAKKLFRSAQTGSVYSQHLNIIGNPKAYDPVTVAQAVQQIIQALKDPPDAKSEPKYIEMVTALRKNMDQYKTSGAIPQQQLDMLKTLLENIPDLGTEGSVQMSLNQRQETWRGASSNKGLKSVSQDTARGALDMQALNLLAKMVSASRKCRHAKGNGDEEALDQAFAELESVGDEAIGLLDGNGFEFFDPYK